MELPPKESGFFKSALNLFENKQYKRGFKVCEHILKKCPNHGDSMCLKGLFVFHLGKKAEGYDLVRQGLRFALKSHISWHIYGLMYKADRNYEEAAKCYSNALKFDPENTQITRDLASIQTQIRNYEGLVDTRLKLLSQRPGVPLNWISLSVALYFAQDFQNAIAILNIYLGFLATEGQDHVKFKEMVHLYYFKASLIRNLEGPKEALAFLDTLGSDFLSVEVFRALRARSLCDIGKYCEASDLVDQLYRENTESVEYLDLVLRKREFFGQSQFESLTVLNKIHPKSCLAFQMYLKGLEGGEFVTEFKRFCLPLFEKGCSTVHKLFKEHFGSIKLKLAVEDLLEHWASLESRREKFYCALFFQAYFRKSGDLHACLSWLIKASSTCDDEVELYLQFSKLMQASAQPIEAWKFLEKACALEPGDRFINTKSVKCLLGHGKFDQAEAQLFLFAKKETKTLQERDLSEMQVIWYFYAVAHAHHKNGDWIKCLELLDRIFEVFLVPLIFQFFSDFFEDQFDFHNYVFRKLTLQDYQSFVKQEDHLGTHPFYLRSFILALDCIIQLKEPKNHEDQNIVSLLSNASLTDNIMGASKWISYLDLVDLDSKYIQVVALKLFEFGLSFQMPAQLLRALSLLDSQNIVQKSIFKLGLHNLEKLFTWDIGPVLKNLVNDYTTSIPDLVDLFAQTNQQFSCSDLVALLRVLRIIGVQTDTLSMFLAKCNFAAFSVKSLHEIQELAILLNLNELIEKVQLELSDKTVGSRSTEFCMGILS